MPKKNGFTLIELLVVISIIAVLLSLLLPTMKEAKRSAKVVHCASNFKQIALGMTMYAMEDRKGEYRRLRNEAWAGPSLIFTVNGGSLPDPNGTYAYLRSFLELELGSVSDMAWCVFEDGLLRDPNAIDPAIGDAYWYHGPSAWLGYAVGFTIFAGWTTPADYSNSGFSSPEAVLRPGTSEDVIFCSRISSESPSHFLARHALSPYDYNTNRENNVTYSDGHVETHNHRPTAFLPNAIWSDHYVRQTYGGNPDLYHLY